MAKITRYSGNLAAFASGATGTERTIFGDTAQSDVLTDNINASFLRGWGIVGVNEYPTKQDFNALGFASTQLMAYLHQMGVAEYDAAQVYYTGSVCQHGGDLYVSAADANTGHAPSTDDGTYWTKKGAPHVNGNASLRLLTPIADKCLYRKYHTTSGDGGALMFYGVTGAAPGTYVDDGGVVIVPTGGDGSAAWLGVYSGQVNVRWFGAKGDGVTSDTASMQAALAYPDVYIPQGHYVLDDTLTSALYEHRVEGAGANKTQFLRTTAYGDTLVFTNPGAVQVMGIGFYHTPAYNNGATYVAGTSTTMTNKDPTSSHIKLPGAQRYKITDCAFYYLGFGIHVTDSPIGWIRGNVFGGIWDSNVSGLQASQACVYLHTSGAPAENQITNIVHNYIGGGPGAGAPVNVTTPPAGGTGSVTVTHGLNIGPRYGVWVESCERFLIADNYIGGHGEHNILLSASSVLSHGEICNNMIDGAVNYSIVLEAQSDTYWPTFIDIHDNTGVGYGIERGFLRLRRNSYSTTASYIQIHHNTVQLYLSTPIVIELSFGVHSSHNQVMAYNSDAALTTCNDPYTLSGVLIDNGSMYSSSVSDIAGGSINRPGGTDYGKWGVYFGTAEPTNWASDIRTYGLGYTGGAVCNITQTYPT